MVKKVEMRTMDGNEACATVAYHFTEVSSIFPITPSSPMAEHVDTWSAQGRKNMYGKPVRLIEMQSEAGAAGALHGVAEVGGLGTTFTASQGLLLMIPNLYIMSGHRMPAVLHVAARSVAQHANNIFGDHQDVMSCRPTGAILMNSGSVQEVMDLAAIAHLTTVKCRIPFIHFFDGFRTSHEIQTIEMIDLDAVGALMDQDALREFRAIAMNPEHPLYRTSVQGPDVYFQSEEANNSAYNEVPAVVEGYMQEINKITGRDYHIFNYYGAEDAEEVIVMMGSGCETTKEVIDVLRAEGRKVGLLQIHLFRPFDVDYFLSKLPKTVKIISAMDRSKESGSIAGALYLDVCASVSRLENPPKVLGGRYGLASKDVTPAQIKAVFDNMLKEEPKPLFTIGIVDDVTNLSLEAEEPFITEAQDTLSFKFWGVGGDGTVGANKNSTKIIGDLTGLYSQAYFEYDSKKSYGITRSHLRFSKDPIRSIYLVKSADFVACHAQSYIDRYDIVQELKQGGSFLFNTSWSVEELEDRLPAVVKRELAKKEADFYIINADKIAMELGLGSFTNLILQSAFFKLSKILPIDQAEEAMKDAARKTYAKKGEKVVQRNLEAIEAGMNAMVKVEIPASWKDVEDKEAGKRYGDDFLDNVYEPCIRQRGDDLPVSALVPYQDGTFPLGSSKYDKRGIAAQTPTWLSDKCIQCNQCAFVCPHAAIRAFLLDEEETSSAPEGFTSLEAKGEEGLNFSIQVSQLDCTGCGNCANICPAKALEMEPVTESIYDLTNWDYALSLKPKQAKAKRDTIKGSQFHQPLLEFSGACAGCGETPYAKLLTQMYGEKTYWVNGVGCTLAWAGAFPSLAYTTNADGHGPAFYGSLFEDTAENGIGTVLAVQQRRSQVRLLVEELQERTRLKELKDAIGGWLDSYDSLEENGPATQKLVEELEKNASSDEGIVAILDQKDQLAKKVVWLYGGDGWAYDIGYGGLDHVMASGEDINILVVDTEVYSNTGGQSSKATPLGASAKFADGGKKTSKKELGRIFMTYPDVYVASVSMGANKNQLVKALSEAVAHKGPSIVIAYAPCIEHGIKEGMGCSQLEMKKVVDAGLWPLYRYNPSNKEKVFSLDYKKPSIPVTDFFKGQVRFASLEMKYPEVAKKLFEEAQVEADKRYRMYEKLEKFYNED